MPVTTIKLSTETKSRLDKLKVHKKDTYEEVLQSFLDILNLCKINPLHARARLFEMEKLRNKLSKPRLKKNENSRLRDQDL